MGAKKKDYSDYLKTDNWKKTALRIKQQKGYICEICHNQMIAEVRKMLIGSVIHPNWDISNIARFEDPVRERLGKKDQLIQVHHKWYGNLGFEKDEDLACVCVCCHYFLTTNAKDNSRKCLADSWNITCRIVHDTLEEAKFAAEYLMPSILKDAGYHKFGKFEEKVERREDYYNWVKETFLLEDDDKYLKVISD